MKDKINTAGQPWVRGFASHGIFFRKVTCVRVGFLLLRDLHNESGLDRVKGTHHQNSWDFKELKKMLASHMSVFFFMIHWEESTNVSLLCYFFSFTGMMKPGFNRNQIFMCYILFKMYKYISNHSCCHLLAFVYQTLIVWFFSPIFLSLFTLLVKSFVNVSWS